MTSARSSALCAKDDGCDERDDECVEADDACEEADDVCCAEDDFVFITAYAIFSPTANPKFEGKVHGVVVQATSETFFGLYCFKNCGIS